jgi:hypothetical protein
MEESTTYTELNKQWHATSAVILGVDVGELKEYRNWLIELNNQRIVKKSSLSGTETVFTSNEFDDNSKFISMNEIDFSRKFEPLTIDEIKDIDSIIEALGERIQYCGNIVLGNSKFVERSANVSDSFFVYDSVRISDSRNIAYSQYLRLCKNIFGTNEGGESEFCIRCSILFRNKRSFELWKSTNCSDCYYSYGLEGCTNSMFSFNLIGKHYAIGNLVLPPDKYSIIRKKLLADMREQLTRKKWLPSLVDITSNADIHHEEVAALLKEKTSNECDDKKAANSQIVSESFTKASGIIFGRELSGNIESYDKWLRLHTIVPCQTSSVISKQPVQISEWPGLSQLPKNRLVTYDEALKIGMLQKITEKEAEKINCLSDMQHIIGRIAYYSPEHVTGVNLNLIECQWGSSAQNCYRSVICAYSKNCAYCSWPRSSEHCFGCGIVFDSAFSLKCYDSVKLTRCFEVDGGRNNVDTYFSHNVEGLAQAMFCFNVKNMHYAIGNVEVEKERYLAIKEHVMEDILEELERTRQFRYSIYNLRSMKIGSHNFDL